MSVSRELHKEILAFLRTTRYTATQLAKVAGCSRELISALRHGRDRVCGDEYAVRIRAAMQVMYRQYRMEEGHL